MEGAIPTPTELPATVPAEVGELEAPAEARRLFTIVWAGESGTDPSPLTRLEDNEWRNLRTGGWITTDRDGEGWVMFSDCMKIYVFQDSRLVKAACPKSAYEGGNVACSEEGTAGYNDQCAAQVIIQTPGSQIVLEGTWLSVTYLPERQVTLTLVFEGQAKAQPVLDADTYSLGPAIDVPAAHFWFSTPGTAADPIAGLAAREPHPFEELLPLVEELDLWRWIGRITARADMDNIPYPAIPPFVPGPAVTQCVPPPDWVVYVVQANDTLFSLAAETGTSVEQVRLVNCLEGDTLVAGESIFLPTLPPPDVPTPVPPPTPVPTPTSTRVPPSADLRIEKTDSADQVSANEAYRYTVTVFNNGPFAAQGVRVTDSLPAEVMTNGVSTSGCNNDPGGVPTCELGTIGAGVARSFTISVTAPSTLEVVTNNARVTSDTEDRNPSNNFTSEDTTVIPQADLRIAKVDSADPVLPTDDVYSYTIIILNDGPSDAQDVTVRDTLSVGERLGYTAGCKNDPNGVPTCELGTIPANGSTSFTIDVMVPPWEGIITNTVNITSTTDDPDASNNTTLETTEIKPWANLSIEKAASYDEVYTSQIYTYTVTVFNQGPSDAQEVKVSDNLHFGTSLANHLYQYTAGCDNDPYGVPVCELGTIDIGAVDLFTITVTAPVTEGIVTNTASVNSSITDDLNPNDNITTITTTVVYRPELLLSPK
jgi:uncharacterized repeat protein (TIGR01451 family)